MSKNKLNSVKLKYTQYTVWFTLQITSAQAKKFDFVDTRNSDVALEYLREKTNLAKLF